MPNIQAGCKITEVFPSSPAYEAGLRAGWVFLTMNGKVLPTHNLLAATETVIKSALLCDPDGKLYVWKSKIWPFGIKLSPPVDQALLVDVEHLTTNLDTLDAYWQNGDLGAFATMRTALRNGVLRYIRENTPGLAADEEIDLSLFTADSMLGFLALAEFQAGDIAAAQKVLDAEAMARRDTSYRPSSDMSLRAYLEARIHIENGDMEQAKTAAAQAFAISPNFPVVQALWWQFSDEAAPEAPNPLIGTTLPFDYIISETDPIIDASASRGNVALADALAKTKDNQLFVILLLGPYRANYYSIIDMLKLAVLHSKFPKLVAGVHVVVAGIRVPDEAMREVGERACKKLGLKFKILHDEGGMVFSQMDHAGAPMRLVVDNTGRILSTKELANESGVWEAYAALGF